MNAFIADKQGDKAVAAANAQIAKVPNSSAFYDLLGTALFQSKKDVNGAEAAFKKSAELDKNNSDALLKLGQVQVAKGSTDQAIATYQQSMKDNPREASFYILTGELYESKQDWDNAKVMYQKALEIKPDYGDAITAKIFALDLMPGTDFAQQQAARREWWTVSKAITVTHRMAAAAQIAMNSRMLVAECGSHSVCPVATNRAKAPVPASVADA